jgi:CheY-like chemotaxis protein
MPKLDGFAVARQMYAQIRRNGAILIAVTGYADHKHRLLCEQAGFDMFLVKPVDLIGLEKILSAQKARWSKPHADAAKPPSAIAFSTNHRSLRSRMAFIRTPKNQRK